MTVSRLAPRPGADQNRRLAELLVESGVVTRRDAEAGLREARRNARSLVNVLLHSGRLPARFVSMVRRLELLLAHQPHCFQLSELLLTSGELSAVELRRMQETRRQDGRSLAELIVANGYLRGRRQRAPRLEPRHFAAAMVVGVVLGTAGMMPRPADAPSVVPTPVATASMPISMPGLDLRFASLGDISPHLQRLRQRPAPYRAPALTANERLHAKRLRPLVNEYARKFELPPALILAVIEQESSFNPKAHSRDNAVGLMQVVAKAGGSAAYHYSEKRAGTPTLKELQDPKTNIRLGTAYLRLLLDRHFDDIEDEDVRVAAALAAYNWGPTRLRSVMKKGGKPESVEELEALLEKHAPRETRNYVRKITERMDAFG